MKKLIIIFLSIFIAISNVHAAGTDDRLCVRASTGDPCPAGCFYDDIIAGCFPCPSGSFYPTQNSTNECYDCTKPDAASFIYNEDTLGNTSDNCPWELTCAAGQYWDGAKCTNCGTYYASAGCTLTGRGPNNPPSNYDTTCIAIVYKLDLKKNTLFSGFNDKTAYYKYNTGFAMNEKPTTWSTKLPSDALQPELSIKKFKGYYTDADCNSAIRVFDNSGEFTGTWASLGGDKTLYACWDAPDITFYYYNSDQTTTWKEITWHINPEEEPQQNIALEYTSTYPSGQTFSHYLCKYGSDTPCNPDIIAAGDPIPFGEVTVNLYPVFQGCPAGHYCTNGKTYNCPAGTTSDPGAGSATNCYMVRGDGGTKFCDNTGDCFYLPGSGHVPHAKAAGN